MSKKIFIIICISLICSGCWDKIEINKRAFISMIGIDKIDSSISKDKLPHAEEDVENGKYIVTITYPNVGLIAGKGGKESKFVYSSTGENIAEIIDGFSQRLGKTLFYRHTKALVLGRSIMKDEDALKEILDFIERSPKFGRKIHIMMSDKSSQEILEMAVKDEAINGSFIREILNQTKRTAKIAHANMEYLLKSLQESNCALVPKLISLKDEYKVSGAAMIKNYKIIGELNEIETRNLMYLFNKVQNSIIKIQLNDKIIPIEIMRSSTKSHIEKDGDNIVVKYTIDAEARIASYVHDENSTKLEDSYIDEVQKIGETKIENQVKDTYNLIKNTYDIDLLQLNESLRKYEPLLWDTIKNKWEKVYPQTKIQVECNLKVRTMGVIK